MTAPSAGVVNGASAGFVNGALIILTRIPDIVVTLAMSFVWQGAALLVRGSPGGSSSTAPPSVGRRETLTPSVLTALATG